MFSDPFYLLFLPSNPASPHIFCSLTRQDTLHSGKVPLSGIRSHSPLFSLSLTFSYSFGLSSSTYQNPCGQGGQGRSTRKAGGWGRGGCLRGGSRQQQQLNGVSSVVFASFGVICKASLVRRFWSQ